jgi:UDP-N-acetylmuramoyl-tripeptide--D-alanyl-D-alanine ligase
MTKKIVQRVLAILAKAIMAKYKPDVIGVTGSFGKTSSKDAIYTVLSHKFRVRRNIKNYNNEIGLPLTIIGASSGGRSVIGWLVAFSRALLLLLWRDKSYPEMLVLEMAVDRPGDMKYLTNLAPCKVGVVTGVGPVHIEFFKTVDRIAKEKSVMVSQVDKNGWAILNCDNDHVCDMAELAKSRVITYGIDKDDADIRATDIKISASEGEQISGISFKLSHKGNSVPIFLPNILGRHMVYAALSAISVGIIHGMNLVDIAHALRSFRAPRGRMNLIDGIKYTHIIDDTYNSGPDAAIAALKLLGELPASGKKIAVLGDMLELGDHSEDSHRSVGEQVANSQVDYLITVGQESKMIVREAQKQGMDADDCFSFSDVETAGRFVQDKIEQGDFVLVKGSQGMRMERVVKEIMAQPMQANELLVRQDKVWQ